MNDPSSLEDLYDRIAFALDECSSIDEQAMGGDRTNKLLQVLHILQAVKNRNTAQLSVVLETTGDIDHVDDDDFI